MNKTRSKEILIFGSILVLLAVLMGGSLFVRHQRQNVQNRQIALKNTMEYQWYLQSSSVFLPKADSQKVTDHEKARNARRELQRLTMKKLSKQGYSPDELARAFSVSGDNVRELLKQ